MSTAKTTLLKTKILITKLRIVIANLRNANVPTNSNTNAANAMPKCTDLPHMPT